MPLQLLPEGRLIQMSHFKPESKKSELRLSHLNALPRGNVIVLWGTNLKVNKLGMYAQRIQYSKENSQLLIGLIAPDLRGNTIKPTN